MERTASASLSGTHGLSSFTNTLFVIIHAVTLIIERTTLINATPGRSPLLF